MSILALLGAGFLAIAVDLKPAPSITVIAIVTAGSILFGGVLPSIDDFRFGRTLRRERYITSELRAAFAFMVESADFNPLKLRLHFFEVRPVWNWTGAPVKDRQWQWGGRPVVRALARAGFFSIRSDEALSNVKWREGVGVVGTVWQNRNVTGFAANVSLGEGASAGQWSRIHPQDRFNMPWALAHRMRRIEAVFAVAVLAEDSEGDVVAVLSADTTTDDLPKFDVPAVRAFLRRTARGAWQSRFIHHN